MKKQNTDYYAGIYLKEEKKVAELNNGYYVYNVTRKTAPTITHGDHQEAIGEAKRLARANPGHKFLVLGVTAACEYPEPDVKVEFTQLGWDLERPF